MLTGLNEECGVFGVVNVADASQNTYLGLHMLQHRGQDGAGIITFDANSKKFYKHKDFGLITHVFDDEKLRLLKGNTAIGHVRYATSGGNEIENIQPFLFYSSSLSFSLCHNGNIINSKQVKEHLERKGSIFQSNSDSEILAHLIMQNYEGDMIKAVTKSLNVLDGAFAFLIMYDNKIIATRDKYGLRPLSIAKLNDGYVIASETTAFDIIGADFICDVKPAQVVEISTTGIEEYSYSNQVMNKMCAMEYIYFARPDSNILGNNVHEIRFKTGFKLAQENEIKGDIVIGVPDSSLSAAIGVSEATNIKYAIGLVKHKYIGRTFIEPTQSLRENSVKLKLSVIRSVVENKDVILVDDSIVRGTTSKKIVSLLKANGAKSVHVVIASPMITGACFYGVDIHSEEELVANNKTKHQIREYIEADSLNFLSLQGLKEVLNDQGICHGCFDKVYPTYIYEIEKRR